MRRGMAIMAAVAWLAQAGGVQAETTLRIGLAEDPDALDPTLARTFVGRIVFASLCDKLFDIGPDLKIVPQLATSYQLSEDAKTLTLQLREGVLFHDGEKMDAAAVKASLERHQKLQGSQRKAEIAAVSSIDVVDEHTIKLNLSAPFAPLIAQLTDRAGMILSPKAVEASGDKFAAHPVCAGPYKFTERVAQDRIVLDRFDRYWNKDMIHIDRIVFLPIPDQSVRLANLRSGGLEMIERVAPSDLKEIGTNKQLKTASIVELGYQSININVGKGNGWHNLIGEDARVREALDLAIDRVALNEVVFEGQFQPGNQWVSPSNPYYDKDIPVPKRDLARAKQLLKEVGKGEITIDFMVPNNSEAMQQGQVIQAMAKEAGINLNIRATEFASALNLADKGDYSAFLINWSGRADPDGNIYNFVACNTPLNYPGYCNSEVDKELNAARQVESPAERLAHYKNVAARTLKDRPILYLGHRQWIYAFTAKLAGFEPYPDGLIRSQGLKMQ